MLKAWLPKGEVFSFKAVLAGCAVDRSSGCASFELWEVIAEEEILSQCHPEADKNENQDV
jgi:hypothetical protein